MYPASRSPERGVQYIYVNLVTKERALCGLVKIDDFGLSTIGREK